MNLVNQAKKLSDFPLKAASLISLSLLTGNEKVHHENVKCHHENICPLGHIQLHPNFFIWKTDIENLNES